MIYEALKDVILNTEYELVETLDKIYVMYIKNKISKTEMKKLETLARENAKAENSYAPLQEQIDKLYEDMKYLESRITALEKEEGEEEPTEPTEEYPEFVQPSGAHDAYHVGDKITYNGKHYECIYNGCVWTPDAYPAGWKLVEESE